MSFSDSKPVDQMLAGACVGTIGGFVLVVILAVVHSYFEKGEQMKGYKVEGSLMRAYAAANSRCYAVCDVCRVVFVDDHPSTGPLTCPGCNRTALKRGLSWDDVKKLRMVEPQCQSNTTDSNTLEPHGLEQHGS